MYQGEGPSKRTMPSMGRTSLSIAGPLQRCDMQQPAGERGAGEHNAGPLPRACHRLAQQPRAARHRHQHPRGLQAGVHARPDLPDDGHLVVLGDAVHHDDHAQEGPPAGGRHAAKHQPILRAVKQRDGRQQHRVGDVLHLHEVCLPNDVLRHGHTQPRRSAEQGARKLQPRAHQVRPADGGVLGVEQRRLAQAHKRHARQHEHQRRPEGRGQLRPHDGGFRQGRDDGRQRLDELRVICLCVLEAQDVEPHTHRGHHPKQRRKPPRPAAPLPHRRRLFPTTVAAAPLPLLPHPHDHPLRDPYEHSRCGITRAPQYQAVHRRA
mmetsp:Transcript_9350/g.23670  ORF Transcript_9350/g.23670 Transcript_9350/m.23670 type:complete len:321 (+) Transcript_9350:121-1083(+)